MSTKNPLEMSDEEFLNAPMPEFSDVDLETEVDDVTDDPEQEEEETTEEDNPLNDPDEEGEPSEQEQEEEDEGTEETSEDDEKDGSEEGESEGEPDEAEESDESDEDEKTEEEEEEKDDKELSEAEKQLARLFAPFKANGKEIRIDSVDDAIQLMQMGANYSKKMAALKPQLKILKMLDNHDLLDESRLSFYIDVEKGKPDAIAKLLKQHGIDPLEVDLDKSEEYKPSTYNVSDNEVAIDSILDEIKDTTTYRRTLDVVSNKWDDSSRQVIIENPELIRVINDHMSDGTFDKITSEMEKDRMLGRLNGLSDIQAYKVTGDKIFQQQPQAQPPASEPGKVVDSTKETKAKDDSKLKSRKKAAGSPKAAPSSKKTDDDFNPLAMSDEEFEKLAANKYR